jgi:hypothetical protein
MQELLESIQAAVAEGATTDQKTAGAQACRTILTALEAGVGKPLAAPGAPASNPPVGIDPTQALDLLIARIRAALPDDGTESSTTKPQQAADLRFSFVSPPPGVPWKKR